MSRLSSEVTEKIHHAIRAKLTELKVCVDEELPEYVMVLIANRKTQSQLKQDLVLFLGDSTELFTNWLVGVLQKLEHAGKLVEKKNITCAKVVDTKPQKKRKQVSSGSENEQPKKVRSHSGKEAKLNTTTLEGINHEEKIDETVGKKLGKNIKCTESQIEVKTKDSIKKKNEKVASFKENVAHNVNLAANSVSDEPVATEEFPRLPPSFYNKDSPSSQINEFWSDISEEAMPPNEDESVLEPCKKLHKNKMIRKKKKKSVKNKEINKEMEKLKKEKRKPEGKNPEARGDKPEPGEKMHVLEEENEQVITLDEYVDSNDSLQAEIAQENEIREKEYRQTVEANKKLSSRSKEKRYRKKKKRNTSPQQNTSPQRKPSPIVAPRVLVKMSSLVVKPESEEKSVHSIVKVKQRPSLPPAMQANTTLILKAVADAQKCLESERYHRKPILSSSSDVPERLNRKQRIQENRSNLQISNKNYSSFDISSSSSSESEQLQNPESDIGEFEINDNTPMNSDEELNLRERLIKNMKFRQKLGFLEKKQVVASEDEEYGPAMPPSMIQHSSIEARPLQRVQSVTENKLKITVHNQCSPAGSESEEESSSETEFIVTLGDKNKRSYIGCDSSPDYASNKDQTCVVDECSTCIHHKCIHMLKGKRIGVFARLGKSLCQAFPQCSNSSCPFTHPEK